MATLAPAALYAVHVPSLPATLDWLFLTLGVVVTLGAITLLCWALFRDRHRARFRCPKCWYDLTPPEGEPTLPITCSECGRTITQARYLRKRHRRWRFAFAALLMIPAAGAIARYPSAQRNGWMSIIPSRVLIDSVPVFGYPTVLTDELWRRNGCTSGPRWAARSYDLKMRPADHEYLVHRVVNGTWFAPPRSIRWKQTLGALFDEFGYLLFNFGDDGGCMMQYVPTPAPRVCTEIERMAVFPADVSLRTRPVWPENVPVYIENRVHTWWPYQQRAKTRVRDGEGGEWKLHIFCPPPIVLASPPGESRGTFEFAVEVDISRFDSAWTPVRIEKSMISVPYRIEGTIDDLMTPVVDPVIDTLVARATNGDSLNMICDLSGTCTARTSGIAFGVIMEYRRDGELVATDRAWWKGGEPQANSRTAWDREWVGASSKGDMDFDQYNDRYVAKAGEHWSVHIRSDPETALRVLDADRYWQGDVTIQLKAN